MTEKKTLTDEELLERLLTVDRERLTDKQTTAFESMQAQRFRLTDKQRKWIRNVGEALGVQVAGAENIFSAMDPDKQARQRRDAAKVKLPWESG